MVLVINFLFIIYYFLLLARIFLPFIPHNRFHPALKPVYMITDPILVPLRQALPPLRIGFDAAPFIALLLVWILQKVIMMILGV